MLFPPPSRLHAISIQAMTSQWAAPPKNISEVSIIRFHLIWFPPPPSAFPALRRLPPPPHLNHDHRDYPRQAVPPGSQAQPIHAIYFLPDLIRDHPYQVFPSGPQPRPSTPTISLPNRIRRNECQKKMPNIISDNISNKIPDKKKRNINQNTGKKINKNTKLEHHKIKCQIKWQIKIIEKLLEKYQIKF